VAKDQRFTSSHCPLPAWWPLRGAQNPIPSRTRPLNSPAPMVLSLKAWKSRSLPGLPRTVTPHHDDRIRGVRLRMKNPPRETAAGFLRSGLGLYKRAPRMVRHRRLGWRPTVSGAGLARGLRTSETRRRDCPSGRGSHLNYSSEFSASARTTLAIFLASDFERSLGTPTIRTTRPGRMGTGNASSISRSGISVLEKCNLS
jgi:hypothetical protein